MADFYKFCPKSSETYCESFFFFFFFIPIEWSYDASSFWGPRLSYSYFSRSFFIFHPFPDHGAIIMSSTLLSTPVFAGSPRSVNVFDPGTVLAFGEGLRKGVKGEEAVFVVQGVENGEGVTASVEGRPA